VEGWRKLAETVLGDNHLHRITKLCALVVPSTVALIIDLTYQTRFFIPGFIAGFLVMMTMIYHNIRRARESR
jgi:hypothetical protein